jgi:hypothetical protein
LTVGAKRNRREAKTVDPELIAKSLAKVVHEGDIVNFRLIFMPFSPARKESPERFESEKYAYLLPDPEMEADPQYQQCLAQVRRPETWRHTLAELEANRPAQLPSELVLALADNAVRAGKYTSAAQAYELIRVRRRMQEEFFLQADRLLNEKQVERAVFGYVIATGLAYNYAAFPEPLPAVPDFQTRALMLHGEYPKTPEDCVAMQESQTFLQTALAYLLLDAEAAARLENRPMDVRVEFLRQLVLARDPEWGTFTKRYRESCRMLEQFSDRVRNCAEQGQPPSSIMVEEIEAQLGQDPIGITVHLMGRTIEGGEWWQYLKELAYEHPASVLFIARQAIGEFEILVPRLRADSPVPAVLGLRPVSDEAEPVPGTAEQNDDSSN